MREYMIQCALHAKGNYDRLSKLIENRIDLPILPFHGKAIVMGDALYPSQLYDLEYPPFVLFYEGNIELLQKAKIASVIGSRTPSDYAIQITQLLVDQLAQTHVIVSGLAKGIDTWAHRHSLDFNTVAVLGCGIDVYYPRENKHLQDCLIKHHCVLSEYPPGTSPKRHHFPFRNRIIAALSREIFVMAAAHKSGTMKTVEEALKINRSVMCLPHPILEYSGQGCNTLIRDGAGVITEHDVEH